MGRTSRERTQTSTRNECVQNIHETRQWCESRIQDLYKEKLKGFNGITFTLEGLHQDLVKSIEMRNCMLEDLDKRITSRIDSLDLHLLHQTRDTLGNMTEGINANLNNITLLALKVEEESKIRTNSVDNIREEQANEHLRREQDEAQLIAMIENFMIQVKE